MSENGPAEEFWDYLFAYMSDGRVIPVVGHGAITAGPKNEPFYPWLADRLAQQLPHPVKPNGTPLTLNQITYDHLLKGGRRNQLYPKLSNILRNECPEPGETLRQLAEIDAFRLYVNAGFDPLLERAINETPNRGRAEVGAFAPNGERKDIENQISEMVNPTIYHILGRVSASQDYAVWDEDLVEFVCGLHKSITTMEMEKLARDLKGNSLLLIGLEFSDWLTRFFLRVTRQMRFAEAAENMQLLADVPESLPKSLILFFDSNQNSNIAVAPCDPVEFVAELSRRWKKLNESSVSPNDSAAAASAKAGPEMEDGAVFLSYAREDGDAVATLKAKLEAQGCVVWFDRERNHAGDDFERNMERAIKEKASVFVSCVSEATEAKGLGWCHRERKWAAKRSEFFSEGEIFYVPTSLDGVEMPFQREPAVFAEAHCEPSPGGHATDAFCKRIRDLQIKNMSLMGLAPNA